MRLYHKRLNNIEELRKEKKRLLKQKDESSAESPLPGAIFGGKAGKDDDGGGGILSMLAGGSPMLELGMKLGAKLLKKKKKATDDGESAAPKKEKSKVQRLLIEIIGGYLKWKAIELSYKGVRRYLKARNERKEAGQDA